MRTKVAAVFLVLASAACSPAPDVECNGAPRCREVVDAAMALLAEAPDRVFVAPGRGIGFHLVVHACFGDGGYQLVDVFGDDTGELEAGLRVQPSHAGPGTEPLCQ
jgi:hypothetical protein